jgi:hypothetical protein
MNQSATGGTFRTRLAAAKQFGVIDSSLGRATLTQLGRDVLAGSGNEKAARVDAFLNVELFRAMYEANNGNVLPPPPAIERQMAQLGVSSKQTERARQTFTKSATYAGFIDQASGRFIKPGVGNRTQTTEPVVNNPPDDDDMLNGGGGGGPTGLDPIIAGLLKRLPKSGDVWPDSERKLWLQLLEGSFKLIYKDAGEPRPRDPGASRRAIDV